MKRFLLFLTTMFVVLASVAQKKEIEYSTSDPISVNICAGTEFQFSLVIPAGSSNMYPTEIRYEGSEVDFSIKYDSVSHEMSGFAKSAGSYSCTLLLNSNEVGILKFTANNGPDFIVSHKSLDCLVDEIQNFNCYMGIDCAISWICDDANWHTDMNDADNRSVYASFSTLGEHLVIATATDANGCSTVDTTIVTTYLHKAESVDLLYVNYNDVIVAEGASSAASIEFSSDFNEKFASKNYEFFIERYGEYSTLSSENIEIKGNFVNINFPELDEGSYTYGLRILSIMEGTESSPVFSADLTVKSTCSVEYKSPVVTLVSEPTEITVLGMQENMIIEIDGATAITVPESEIPAGRTLARFSITVDEIGENSHNITWKTADLTCSDWGSILIATKKKLEAPVLTQKSVTICLEGVSDEDEIDLNSYVQKTTTSEDTYLEWYLYNESENIPLETSIVSKNQIGKITYLAQYVSYGNALIVPSDSVALTFNFVSPYEMYVEFDAPEEVSLSDGAVVTVMTSGAYLDGCTTEWICDGVDFTAISDADKDPGKEKKLLAFKSAGLYELKVTTTLTGTACIAEGSAQILVKGNLPAPKVAEKITICKSDLADGEKSLSNYIEYNSDINSELQFYNATTKDTLTDVILSPATEAGLYNYSVWCISHDDLYVSSDVVSFSVEVINVAAPEVTPENAILCSAADSVQFSAKASNTIIWYTDEYADLSDSTQYRKGGVCFGNADIEKYYVRSKDDNGCLSDVKTASITVADMYVELDIEPEVTLPDSLQVTAFAPEGTTFTWTCTDATITSVNQDGTVEAGPESKKIAFAKAGKYTLVVLGENKETGCSAKSEVEITVNAQPQMLAPQTEETSVCKTTITENGLSFGEFVTNLNDSGSLKWYDESGAVLTNVPVLTQTSEAKAYTYYVSCVSDDNSALESEKAAVKVTIIDNEIPIVENTNQRICSFSEIKEFVAKSENVIWMRFNNEWALDYTDTTLILARGSKFMPSDSTIDTYAIVNANAFAYEECVFDYQTATFQIIKPTVYIEFSEEEVTLPNVLTGEASGSEVNMTYEWSCDGAEIKNLSDATASGEEGDVKDKESDRVEVSFKKSGEYTVKCVVSFEGCITTETRTITVYDQPKLVKPVVTDSLITVCKNTITENGYSLYDYVDPSSVSNLQWTLSNTEKVYTEAPVLPDTIAVGTYTYILQNVALNESTLDSDPTRFTVKVVEVAAPEVAEEVIVCTPEESVVLTAKSENTVLWSTVYDYIETNDIADTAVYKTGATVTSSYIVNGVEQSTWNVWATDGTCYSNPSIVKVALSDMYVELGVDSEVTLPDSLLATAYAPEGSTFTWTCSNARISAAESEPAEIATESKFIAFDAPGSYTLVVFAQNEEIGCSAKSEVEILVNKQTVYSVSPEKLSLLVGESQELTLLVDGEAKYVPTLTWDVTNSNPEGFTVATVYDDVVTAENPGTADIIAYVDGIEVAAIPLTVVERKYHISPERPQIIVNKDTVTVALYNSRNEKIGFNFSFVELKEQGYGPSALSFDTDTDFDNDVVKIWATGNVGGVGILTLSGREGQYEFSEEFEIDAIFSGNEYHIADMYLTLGSAGQKIQAYNQKGEAVDMPEYTVCDPFSNNCMEPETSDQYICRLLGDNSFNVEDGMVVPTKCGYGRIAFYNSIGLVSFFQVFVVDKNNYSFSGIGDEKGIAVGTDGYLSLSKLVESGNSKELIDVTTAKYVSDNPNVLNIVQEENTYKFVALAQGTATVSVYDGEELVASQLVTVLGETVRIEKVVLLSQGEITIQDIFGNDVPADAKWEVAPYVGESSAITLSGNTIKLNDAGVIVIKGESMEATLYISQQEEYMVMAGAHLADGNAIASNNITLHYGMPSSYGASEQAYLYAYQLPTAAGAEFVDIVSENVTWKASIENVVELKRTSIGEAYIFPLDTTATITMTAYYQEKEIGSVTVQVIGKEKEKDYSIAFSEQAYRVKVNETATVCYTLGSSFDATTTPIVYVSDNSIAQVEDAVSTTMNCITVKGLQEGETTIVAKVANSDTTYLAEVALYVIPEEAKPQLEKPGFNTNEIALCYEKSSQKEEISLEEMAYPTMEIAMLQWYDNAGNKLEKAPMVSSAAVGTTTYYVSQVPYDATVDYLESEKVPFTVTVSYVAEPTLNMYDQKICDGSNAQAFVAKSQEGNKIKWLYNGQTIAEGNTFMPTESGSFDVYAYNEEIGCSSEKVTVTNTIGHPIEPSVKVASQTFAPGEQIELSASIADTTSYGIVWKVGEEIVQGSDAVFSFNTVGSYEIICQAIEKETGCVSEKVTTVSIEKKTVLVDSLVVNPNPIELYVDEKTNYTVSVYPSFATNKKYTGYIDNPEVAIVRGSVIYGLTEGETFLQLTSKDKNATVVVPIVVAKKYVPVQAISLPNIITMAVGDAKALEATIKPDDATNKNVEFSIVGEGVISLVDNVLTAVGDGTATLVAKVDNVFSTTVVYVTSSQEVVTDIIVPEKVVLKEGDSKAITCKVAPVTLAANDLTWEIADETIASLDKDVVIAKAIGQTELKISSGNITKLVTIEVNKSDAPVISFPENFFMPNAQDAALKSLAPGYTVIPIDGYVSDDNTSIGKMSITVVTDQEAVTASVDENGKILVNAGDFIGTVKITVTVTDIDGLVSTGSFYLVVENVKNQAPEIIAETIQLKYDEDVYVNFADIAKDDYTAVEDLIFNFSIPEEFQNSAEFEVVGKQLRIYSITEALSPDLGFLNVTVADIYGEETTGKIALVMNTLPNKAPVISEIADQIENDTMSFTSLDLRQYVKDDFTSASAIVWSAESSANLAITITDGVAVPTVLNKFWNGVEAITFVAKDEEGLTSSVVVYYKRKVSQESYDNQVDKKDDIFASKWDGAPTVTISTMRQIGVPGDVFVLMANISSFDCTWEWNIEGAQGIDQTSMLQMITFDKPGVYPVALTVTSADEKYSITANLAINLTVVGIQDRDLFICQGQSAQLNATDGVNSYYWSTGEVAQTVSVRPEKTTSYAVTMKKGMFTLIDSVTVHVSVPVALMEDSVMCVGTTFELEAQGEYNSYSWNTGADTKSIMIPAEVATYSVFAVDSMLCASVDTFNLTKVNELPKINLGDDQTPCDGTTVTLNAGEGYTYLWSNGATTQTIDLVDSTRTIWAQITDENLCVNSDTVTVAFTYPFPEQIGVATFSETTDHIIIAWEKTKDVNTVSYRVERETDMTDNWEQVGDDVMFDESGIVVDEDVNYKQRAYKYRLVTVDGCQNEAISEVHRSMISTITYQTNGLQTINWCAYEPMENVTQYLVLRGTDATAMDTVDKVPASNLYEIWNETDPKYKGDENIKYRVVFRLKSEINENAYNTLEGQPVAGAYTKAESGPFSLALSNIAEVENDVAVKDITFPADVVVYPTTINTVINVAIASHNENNYLVEVLNANGQVVIQTEAENVGNAIISLPAAHLSQGLYSVRISTNGNVKTIKVVK
ncbi:MAG: T9SS type A sorting domain-containing protein [Bacteroidales bacterium]|nr:T9SS type A sorting domain-containing protein [Bacteroidales bacterium]